MALFGLGGGYCFHERWWGRPQARADASGITGYPVGFHVRRRFVPWSEVATCEIETHYNTFGEPVIVRPILRSHAGEILMTMDLCTTIEEQGRLVKYIKAKLPRAKDNFWE
jgi:hypothetical protein